MTQEDNDLIRSRKHKLAQLRSLGIDPYGQRVTGLQSIASVLQPFQEGTQVHVAGRLMAVREMGKAAFLDLRDSSTRIQLYIKKKELPENIQAICDQIDIGDIVAIRGKTFTTKTQEPSIHVESLEFLSKAVRPLPEKWHGLKDTETRYRQRYADLISSPEVRDIFKKRSHIVSAIRRHLDDQGYLEVETPMMHPIPGGAAGKPFKTHHEALDMSLFMRVAPELYLKKLLVGGFEKVYELNKCFRNEGISTRHNPEFTMLEVYTSYADVEDVMNLTEKIIQSAAQAALGTLQIEWQGQQLDLSHFDRVSFADLMRESFGIDPADELDVWAKKLKAKGVKIDEKDISRTKLIKIIGELIEPARRKHPVFVTDYFTELCPLAKKNPKEPLLSLRFELFVGEMELANGYSELNDPEEQLARFQEDLKAGDKEHHQGMIDEDFVRALEFGMPPAGGLGIGIDRLTMILTNQASIREVVLFPQLKPEAHS